MALRSLKQRVGLAALVATIIGVALGAPAWAVDPPDTTATATVTGPAIVTAAQGRTTNFDLSMTGGGTLPCDLPPGGAWAAVASRFGISQGQVTQDDLSQVDFAPDAELQHHVGRRPRAGDDLRDLLAPVRRAGRDVRERADRRHGERPADAADRHAHDHLRRHGCELRPGGGGRLLHHGPGHAVDRGRAGRARERHRRRRRRARGDPAEPRVERDGRHGRHRVVHLHAGRRLLRHRLVHLLGDRRPRALRPRDGHDHREPGEPAAGGRGRLLHDERGHAADRGAPGVLANDADPDGDALTAVLATGPANGSVTLNADGSFAYIPMGGFSGTDSFTYRANDGALDSNVATVTITVNAVNHPPVAVDGSVTTNEDTAAAVTLSASDPDGDPLTYSVLTGPSHGTLSGTAPDLTYTPAANYNGPDAFTFTANDGTVDSNVATVSITVVAVPDYKVSPFVPPIANKPYVNLAVAGRTLPFIFRVTDGNGKRVTTLTGADVSVVASFGVCGTGATFPVRLYGGSGLVLLPGGWYLDSFKTQTSWAGQCATITVSTPYGGSQERQLQVHVGVAGPAVRPAPIPGLYPPGFVRCRPGKDRGLRSTVTSAGARARGRTAIMLFVAAALVIGSPSRAPATSAAVSNPMPARIPRSRAASAERSPPPSGSRGTSRPPGLARRTWRRSSAGRTRPSTPRSSAPVHSIAGAACSR